jgi:S1-C subfamily serine protease
VVRLLTLLALLPLLATGAFAADDDVFSSVVKITTTYQGANYSQPWKMLSQNTRTGSGCIIDGKRILTNAHVVSDQTFIQVRRAGSADRYVAQVQAVSHELDLALLEVPNDAFFEGAVPVELGSLPAIGDPVTALGFPSGGTRITITEGIVSRIERAYYSHSYFDNLACQIDAAINPGSSGGPVIADGKIVGVAFQTGSGENVGYVIPAPVVKHFLDDLADGRHDGAPALPCAWQVMENRQLRKQYGMGKDQSGILITSLAPLFEGEDKLQTKDVILAIDGYDIANDGTIAMRPRERITFRYAIDRKHVGDELPLRILRDGEEKDVVLRLTAPKTEYGHLVPRIRYDERPSYYVIGGLVFSPLTSNYYDAWDGWADVPLALKRYYYVLRTRKNEEREQVLVLIDFLPDELNVGFNFEDNVVAEVNGRKVNSLKELVAAFEENEDDQHRIVFEAYDFEIVLQRDLLEKRGAAILENYGIPADRSPDLR